MVADYEERGDALVRGSVLAGRFPELAETFEGGREAHKAWVRHVFASQLKQRRGGRRERTATLLATVLDVSVWKQLRRDDGLDDAATRGQLRRLVEGARAAS